MNSKQKAEHATIQSFINCYLREAGGYKLVQMSDLAGDIANRIKTSEVEQVIDCYLAQQGIHLYIPLAYWSVTERHIFSFPLYYSSRLDEVHELDYITMTSLLIKELNLVAGLTNEGASQQDELMLRVILSCQSIEHFIQHRFEESDRLYQSDLSFIEAEQALIFGHLLHPTPKSRQGIAEWDVPSYSPELKGEFQLHYFLVHHSIVYHRSALNLSAVDLVKQQVLENPDVSSDFKSKYGQNDEHALLPIHPWQAEFLMRKPSVQKLIEEGLITSLGHHGRSFYPTSSVRTVYHPKEKFMYKFSLNIKITNSVRANKNMELERGVEVKNLLKSKIGSELWDRYPDFQIICDPAFMTVKIDGEKESGFEVILRENPFYLDQALNATPIASLCQDSMIGQTSRLAEIIKQLAEKEGRTTEEVSVDWFKCYLERSLDPIIWLFMNYGIALEAHQQNSVIQLKDGYPDRFFYRDNQGYYFCESYYEQLNQLLPGISEKSNTVCSDAIADERLRYYFYFNHLLGLVNAFGVGGLIDERKLIKILREYLANINIPEGNSSQLIESLLTNATLPCKANLLTRFHDMDELTGSLETQSVYVEVKNPLVENEVVKNESL